MDSAPNSDMFPHVPPPPAPGHPISPPSPPAHPISPPPPPPHVIPPPPTPPPPPPPPHIFPPPPPHVFPPPPPHVTPIPPHVVPPPPPPLPPDHHPIVIVIVIVSFGGLLFLACLFALWCFLKKRKKNIEKTHDEIVKVDEHLKIKEAIEEGPHGKKVVVLSVEDDVHTERIDMDEMKMKESLGQENMHETTAPEVTPTALEEGRSSSSPKNHHINHDS